MNVRMIGHKKGCKTVHPLERIRRTRITEFFPAEKPKRKPTPKCVNQSAGFSVRKAKKKNASDRRNK